MDQAWTEITGLTALTAAGRTRAWTDAAPRRASADDRHAGMRLAGAAGRRRCSGSLVYLGSLAALFVTAFWTTDSFTSLIGTTFTLENFRDAAHRAGLPATVIAPDPAASPQRSPCSCVVIALPIAFFMAKVARRAAAALLVVAVLDAAVGSYLVKGYAWRTILAPDGGCSTACFGADARATA